MSSRTSERAKVRKALIDKAIADDVQPRFPRGGANFTLPLGGSKRALLVRSDNTFTREREYWSAKHGQGVAAGHRLLTETNDRLSESVHNRKRKEGSYQDLGRSYKRMELHKDRHIVEYQ